MIFIAAGNYGQAEQHAKAEGLAKGDWKYVASIRDIRGERGVLRVVGTFWNRKDSAIIYGSAQQRGMCE